MANAIVETLLAKRTHKVAGRGKSRAMQFGNGQILVTVPREIARWKHIGKGTLLSYSAAMKDERIIAATSPIYPREKVSKSIELGYKFVSVLFVRLSILFRRPSLVGSNFAIRKDVFDKVGGFNERFMTYEDWTSPTGSRNSAESST